MKRAVEETTQPEERSRKVQENQSNPLAFVRYKPDDNLFDVFKQGKSVTVLISFTHLAQDVERKIWGTDVYTDNSDLVTVCRHLGLFDPKVILKEQQIIKGAVVVVKIGGEKKFISTFKNKIRSKGWTNHDGNSYTIESFKLVRDNTYKDTLIKKGKPMSNFTTSELENQRYLTNYAIVYNLSSDPAIKYNLNLMVDQGFEEAKFTSARFQNEVMFFETKSERFEICYVKDRFVLNKVKNPVLLDRKKMGSLSIPLTKEHVSVVEGSLQWHDFQWGIQKVVIKGVEYPVSNIAWFAKKK